jgi:hypothetical protein
MATSAATASFQRACERASHHAIGVPMTRRMSVVVAASSSGSRTGCAMSGGSVLRAYGPLKA